MKISEIAAALRIASADMMTFALKSGDMDYPDQMVLPFITNFLSDDALRRLSTQGLSPSCPAKVPTIR
jgi:hypothetical protein